jgi:hypothetical protein
VIPFRFTCSYSERCVSRRIFGNENELTFVGCVARNSISERAPSGCGRYSRCAPCVQKKSSTENRGRLLKRKQSKIYCGGDSAGVSSAPAGDSVVSAGDSVVASGASVAAGLVISVAAGGGVVGVGVVSGATVSVFCSHAARRAALARMQMYFFII